MVLAALLLAGCVEQRPLTMQEQRDVNECRFAASMVAGYNMVNQMMSQEIAFRNCLAAKGY